MIKFNNSSNSSKNKSYKNGITVLALVLLFFIILASMVLKYSVKCDFGINDGFHLDLSPTTCVVSTDTLYHTATVDILDSSPNLTSLLSE